MGREIDRRDFAVDEATPERRRRLRSLATQVSDRLPGEHRVAVAGLDPTTGTASAVVSQAAPPDGGNFVQRALDHVQRIAPALGLEPAQPVEYTADPTVQRTSSGAATVHLQQRYKGIPVFEATQAVRFGPGGAIEDTVGRPAAIAVDIDVTPRLSAAQAVGAAARHVAAPDPDEREATDQFGEPLTPPAVDVTGFTPTATAAFTDRPDQPSVFTPGPFGGPIRASLIWFPLSSQELRLAWQVLISLPDDAEQWRVLVDAATGEVLYARQLVRSARAWGQVFRRDGDGPRERVDFPPSLAAYGLPVPDDLPQGFPGDWVDLQATVGNCSVAHLGDDGPTAQGDPGADGVAFDPDPTSVDQWVVNLFHHTCYLHDWFYLLGFREPDGNFQRDDLGRGGLAADPVDARAYDRPVWGTASMATPVDGASPVMRMGVVASTNRHTALDASVVIHEFTHGVTNRLVGGRVNSQALEEPQSAGMGEGWSDFFACTVLNTDVVAAWATGRPTGIRAYPYTSDFPDTFADLGTGRYVAVHAIGELWCATLRELARSIGDDALAAQLVVDSLKLMRANPSFLDARDAILLALDHRYDAGRLPADRYAALRHTAWTVFARFGMGTNASCAGASLTGVQPDFTTPDLAVPAPAVPAPAVSPPPSDTGAPSPMPSGAALAQPGEAEPAVASVTATTTAVGDDDFTRIKGIGAAIARNLRRAGIRTFAQLAAMSPAEVARHAGNVGGVDAVIRQDWVGAARALAAARPSPATPPGDRQRYATFTVELLLDQSGEVRRTRVVHLREGGQEGGRDVWAGWESGRLVRYFVEHAELREPAPADVGAPPPDARPKVGELRFEQLAETAGAPGRMRADLAFAVEGRGSAEVAVQRRAYFVHFLAAAVSGDDTTVLAGTRGHLEPARLDYRATVEFDPPPPGRYQLLGVVVLSDLDTLGVAVGPRLRVVP